MFKNLPNLKKKFFLETFPGLPDRKKGSREFLLQVLVYRYLETSVIIEQVP